MPQTQTARALVTDAIALAKLQPDGHAFAVLAWPTELPADPTTLVITADGRGRTLLWHGDSWQLGIGQAWQVAADGPGRVSHLMREHARLESRTLTRVHGDVEHAPSLPACLTAHSFEARPPAPSHWGAHLPGGSLWLPRRLLWRQANGQGWTIAAIMVSADDQVDAACAHLLSDPPVLPAEEHVTWPSIGGDYKDEVEDAIALIRDGALRKVVLARAVDHPLPADLTTPTLIARLRKLGERATLYFHDLPGAGIFCGITPELLFTAEDNTITTMALAGTTHRGKSADEDAGLVEKLVAGTKERKEHGVVVEHLVATLRERTAPFTVPSSPHPRLLDKVIHLESVITATLERPDYLDVLCALHPTPAVCGLPTKTAGHYIARREKLHRGLYAGAIGYIAPRAARIVVPLRGGILRPDLGMARLFAGAGIIETSDPQQELAETTLKLSVMQQVLS